MSKSAPYPEPAPWGVTFHPGVPRPCMVQRDGVEVCGWLLGELADGTMIVDIGGDSLYAVPPSTVRTVGGHIVKLNAAE